MSESEKGYDIRSDYLLAGYNKISVKTPKVKHSYSLQKSGIVLEVNHYRFDCSDQFFSIHVLFEICPLC